MAYAYFSMKFTKNPPLHAKTLRTAQIIPGLLYISNSN